MQATQMTYFKNMKICFQMKKSFDFNFPWNFQLIIEIYSLVFTKKKLNAELPKLFAQNLLNFHGIVFTGIHVKRKIRTQLIKQTETILQSYQQ